MCAVFPCQSWGYPGRTTPSIRANRRIDPPGRRPPDHLRSSAGDAVGAIGPDRADDHGHGHRSKVEARCQWVGVGARQCPKMPGRGTWRRDAKVAAGKPGADRARSRARRGRSKRRPQAAQAEQAGRVPVGAGGHASRQSGSAASGARGASSVVRDAAGR
jgi:hypothetical protein